MIQIVLDFEIKYNNYIIIFVLNNTHVYFNNLIYRIKLKVTITTTFKMIKFHGFFADDQNCKKYNYYYFNILTQYSLLVLNFTIDAM